MSLQDTRGRQGERDRFEHDDHRVLSFLQWCQLNGISPATGRRTIAAGNGPHVIQLSARRIGITVAENRRWQAARMRGIA